MSHYQKSFNRRVLVIYALVLAFGVGCLVQIVYLATWQYGLFSGEDPKYCLDKTKSDLNRSSSENDVNHRCVVTKNDIIPVRGDILDEEGNILASDFTVFDVVIDGRQPRYKNAPNDTLFLTPDRMVLRSNKEAVNKLISELADQFYFQFKNKFTENSKEHYRKLFAEAFLGKKNVDILKSILISETTLVTAEDTAFIRKMPQFQNKYLKQCLGFQSRFKRIYPYGELAKRTIGTVLPGAPSGLEKSFDEWLSGTKGAQKLLYIDGISVPSKKYSNPHDGANIHTTLNLRMQNIVYEALMDKLFQKGAQWGCAIVMEIETGEVKAIANLKRNTNEKGILGYFETFNYALRPECEPGSTFKLASLLAYLEKVPNDSAKTYLLCGCEIASLIKRYHPRFETQCKKMDGKSGARHRPGKPIEIFQRSLNEGTATMVFDAYKNNFQAYVNALDSMGITMPFVTQLDTMKTPKIIKKKEDLHNFYTATWGAFNMAPIQTLTYFNGVANNGKMVCPKFVSYITEQDKVVEAFPTVVLKEQMTRKDVIIRAKKYLEAVVAGPYGTARAYKDSIPRFAGKTGTRDIYVLAADGKTWLADKSRNSVSFCGYFPVDNPKYSMIVYMYDVKGMSGSAVELFYTIAKRIWIAETPNLHKEVDKSGGVKNTLYLNIGK
jgi:cell division protein FtsI (penicillin-binding protein 3)